MVEQNEELKDKIENCIDFIYFTLLEAEYNLHVWLELFPIEERVQILNRYRGFFIPTIKAHKDMLYVNLCKILEYSKDSYNFNYLFNLVKRLYPTVIDIESERQKIFTNHAKTIENAKRYRDRQIAHVDRRLIPLKAKKPGDKLDPEIGITLGEIKSLIKTLETSIGEISTKTLRRHLSFRLDRAQDSSSVIGMLKAQ